MDQAKREVTRARFRVDYVSINHLHIYQPKFVVQYEHFFDTNCVLSPCNIYTPIMANLVFVVFHLFSAFFVKIWG